ncbi:hypothetical protein ACRAWD_26380 [Caulobacter segnis]
MDKIKWRERERRGVRRRRRSRTAPIRCRAPSSSMWKKANIGVTPGLEEFLKEFTSDAATGRGGYLRLCRPRPDPAAPGQHEARRAC